MVDASVADWLPVLIAIVMWFAGYDYGVKRGVRRGHEEVVRLRPPISYVELPCFGGPRDGEMIQVNAECDKVRVPFIERAAPAWQSEDEVRSMPQSFLRQALYQRLWIGEQEQLVYQGTISG